ncbi:MAG: sulfotransferase [Pseudomonadota bacterium]
MSTVAILLSDKRSGSTMLQTELCKHPDIQHVASSPHTYSETHFWLMAAVLLGRPNHLFAGRKTYQGYGSRKDARALVERLIKENIPDFVTPKTDEDLVFEGWEALCKRFAQPVFFEKSPQFLAHWAALDLLLEWISKTKRQVRIIGLVRNPMAVQYSARNLFGTDPEHRQFAWLHAYKNLLSFEAVVPNELYMRVKYEDVASNPEHFFDEVQRFLGVESNLSVGSGVHTSSFEKWRDDQSFRPSLDEAVIRMAGHYGYASGDFEFSQSATAKTSPTEAKQSAPQLWVARQRYRVLRPAIMRVRSLLRKNVG